LFGRSLFFVGELGFNDYALLLNTGKNVQQLRSLVPDVIRTISMAIEVSTHSTHCHSVPLVN
jgi:hypothetical protein